MHTYNQKHLFIHKIFGGALTEFDVIRWSGLTSVSMYTNQHAYTHIYR